MQIVRSKSNRLTSQKLLLVAIAVCVLGAVLAASASAATYSVYACAGPGSEPLPNSSWLTSVNDPSQTLSFDFGSNCGDLSVQADPSGSYAAGDGAEYVFDPPAGTTISGYALDRTATVDFGKLEIGRSQLSAGVRETTGDESSQLDCDTVYWDCSVGPGVLARSGLELSRLSIGVRCDDAEHGCWEGSFNFLGTQLQDARVDLNDPTAPVLAAVGGTLPGSSGEGSARTVDVTSTDGGGGVASIQISLDGGDPVVAGPGGSCGQPYTLRAPCPSGFAHTFHFNTAGLASGFHTAVVTATDAAGNVSEPSAFAFEIVGASTPPAGGGTTPTNGSPAVDQPVATTDDSVISAGNDKSVTVAGTLTTADGRPIAGAVLDVVSLDLGIFDAKPTTIGTVTTSAMGRFSLKVKPHGAHRISIIFKPYAGSIGTAVTSTIVREKLSVSVKRSQARIRPGGQLTLTGKLSGTGDAADETPVEIDARIAGGWRAVGVVRADAHGRYKWKYRFVRVKQATRFTFRAIVRRNKSWPWPTESSGSVNVLVGR